MGDGEEASHSVIPVGTTECKCRAWKPTCGGKRGGQRSEWDDRTENYDADTTVCQCGGGQRQGDFHGEVRDAADPELTSVVEWSSGTWGQLLLSNRDDCVA